MVALLCRTTAAAAYDYADMATEKNCRTKEIPKDNDEQESLFSCLAGSKTAAFSLEVKEAARIVAACFFLRFTGDTFLVVSEEKKWFVMIEIGLGPSITGLNSASSVRSVPSPIQYLSPSAL